MYLPNTIIACTFFFCKIYHSPGLMVISWLLQGREVLMRAVLDRAASVQKRVAAYLILMKNPTPAELAQLAAALLGEENPQVKSFIISHISNILSSTAPETLE